MGGFCVKISAVGGSPGICKSTPTEETMAKELNQGTFSTVEMNGLGEIEIDTGASKPQLPRASSHKSSSTGSKPTTSGKKRMTKVTGVSSLFGRAGGVGIGKALDVFDMLASSMTSLKPGGSFGTRVKTKGRKVSILAFEVASTVVKGANIINSLSRESIRHLNEVVLPSEGIQRLVSDDHNKLARIAAADKREEVKAFRDEVVRFGNQCKDPRWHNLDRYFTKFNPEFTPKMQLKVKAVGAMQYLRALVQCTANLYHEMYDLGKFEQDYQQRLKEIDHPAQRGDTLLILKKELKRQRKHVKSLKKKSLWSRSLEEVVANFVDIVLFLHAEIHNIFGMADGDKQAEGSCGHESLGLAGLALHYANVITQIFTLVTRPSSVPPSTRDALYQALPPSMKSALKSRLQSVQQNKELNVPRIKSEMEKTLLWLVPVASNTLSAHQGFGWVGEWAKMGSVANSVSPLVENIASASINSSHLGCAISRRIAVNQPGLVKIETLHHADKAKTEEYILELVVWLHHLIIHSRPASVVTRSPVRSPACYPATVRPSISSPPVNKSIGSSSTFILEDSKMQKDVDLQTLAPGICKSQEFDCCRPTTSKHKLSKKSSDSWSMEKER